MEGQSNLLESSKNLGSVLPCDIQQYFSGATVFLTGGTGFIGKLLLEKLLRSCPDINRIYLLIRPKKGKTNEERYSELSNSIMKLKLENTKFVEQITLISGDCALPGLGLSSEDKQRLINEVSIVFHCAATVRFDEKIRTAAFTNVRATRDLIFMAKEMKNLKSIIYVSTAYSNCVRGEIKEELYESVITGNKLLSLVDALNDDLLEKLTPTLIGEWPNTYAFTKAIAEHVVQTEGKCLPIAVVKPSIVISTSNEPLPGWNNNVYGATGLHVGACTGLIRTLHCVPSYLADLVPADFVVNCTMAAAWDVGISKAERNTVISKNNNNTSDQSADIPIYNYVSSVQKPICWSEVVTLIQESGFQVPSPLSIWYPFIFLNSNYYVHKFWALLLHIIPAYFVDFVAYCLGKERMLVKGYKKIDKFINALAYFTTNEWRFRNNNTQALWKRLSLNDQKHFNFDMETFDWSLYFHSYIRGARVYLLKDPLDTVPQGRRKMLKLKIAHCVLVGLSILGILRLLLFLFGLAF